MYDISKLSNEELLNYQYNYLIRHCIDDLAEMIWDVDISDKGLFVFDLHNLILKYNPNY